MGSGQGLTLACVAMRRRRGSVKYGSPPDLPLYIGVAAGCGGALLLIQP